MSRSLKSEAEMSEFAIWNELGNIYCKIGAYDEAIAAYNKAIEMARDLGWLYSSLGMAYYHKGEYAEAVSLYLKSIPLLKSNKEKAVMWDRLGDTYQLLNDYRNAIFAYQKADELEALANSSGNDLIRPDETATASAKISSDAEVTPHDARESAAMLRKPVNWECETEYEPQLSAAEKWGPAESSGPTIPILGPSPTEKSSAPVVLDLEQPSRAPLLTTWVLPQMPVQDEDGVILNDTPDEREQARLSHETEEDNASAASGDISEAGMDQANYNIGQSRLNWRMSNIEDDVAVYEKITEINPTNDRAWDTLGLSLKTLGRYEEALSAFKQAISLAPTREVYYYHLGLVYAALKRHEEAVGAFRRVIELNPEYVLAHGALAGSYRRLGLDAEAAQHIQIALPKMQNENEYNRACFEAICGNVDNSIEMLKIALEKTQTTLEWVRCDPDLDSIRDNPRFKALVAGS